MRVIIEENDRFLKQTIRNRYRVYSAQGPLLLTVPLIAKSSKLFISEITIDYNSPWQKEHLRTLEAAYSSTPFFEHYIGYLAPIFSESFDSLLELNRWSFNKICDLLDLELKVEYSKQFVDEPASLDFRPKRIEKFYDVKPTYYQLNMDRNLPFESNLSILDILFNLGPESRIWLKTLVH